MASAFGTEKANLSQEAFEKIEQFVVFMYEKNNTVTTVNAARQKLFSQSHRKHSPYLGCSLSAHPTCSLSNICLGPVSPKSTKVAIRLGMDQERRTTRDVIQWLGLLQPHAKISRLVPHMGVNDCKSSEISAERWAALLINRLRGVALLTHRLRDVALLKNRLRDVTLLTNRLRGVTLLTNRLGDVGLGM